MGGLGYITGRRHLAIPAQIVLSHLLCMAVSSSMAPSLSPVSVDMLLGPGGLIRSLTGPLLP